jgi:hypothetical protein
MKRHTARLVVVAAFLAVKTLCGQEPESFGEAWKTVQEGVEAMQAGRASAKALQTRLDNETDETARVDLQKKLEDANKAVAGIQLDLATKVEVALKKVEPTTPIDDVNRARYLKCYLKYYNGDLLEAAQLGESLTMQHPKSEVGLPCAKIALASYVHLYRAKEGDAAKVKLLANHIVANWPNHPDAATARGILKGLE